MRLKSIEIKGFKSFANETILNFNHQVVGVVGPNGSGKSNIVDAIRWVLGEQKGRELRLEKMTDVIFNGTKTRKSAGVASVNITFENTKNLLPTEYQNVSIARYLYRSGESEYRLNNVACRLKDIRSLLIDTGIGSNSYAIIALGMVDDILADKDQARRKMFEQAAGISKYKIRKRETINKLKITSADLDRVQDLLFEIEGNMKTLEKQAKRTKKYFELKDQYKELSIKNALLSIQTFKENNKGLTDKIAESQDSYRKLDVEIRTLEAELQKVKKDQLNKEEMLSSKQKELNEFMNAIRDKENRKGIVAQQIEFKEQSISKLSDSIKGSNEQLTNLNAKLEELRSKLTDEKTKENELQNISKAAEQELNEIRVIYNETKDKFDVRTRKRQELQEKIFGLEKDLAILANGVETQQIDLNQLAAEMENYSTGKKEFEKSIVEFEKKIKEQKEVLEGLLQKELDTENAKKELESELEELKAKLSVTNRKIDSTQNEFDLLQSMIDNLEGFPESLKFLSKNWKSKSPILSDILDVDEEYKAVIEQYLEAYLNYFIVQNTSEAKKAIDILKEAQKGKAHFFLLDQIKTQSTEIKKLADFIPAVEVVKIDSKYSNLLNHLLKDAYVYIGNDNEEILNKSIEGITVLSKHGTFIKKEISLSGGSVGLFEGKKIGRKKNLEKLEKSLSKLSAEREQYESKEQKLVERINRFDQSQYKAEIETKRNAIRTLENSNLAAQTQLSSFNESNKSVVNKANILKDQIAFKKESISTKDVQLKSLKEEFATLENVKDSNDSVEELAGKLSVLSEKYSGANIKFLQQQNIGNSLQQEITFTDNRIKELNSRIEEGSSTNRLDTDLVVKLKDELKEINIFLEENYAIKASKSSALNEVEQTYFGARSTIHESEDSIREKNRKLNQLQVSINTMKEKYSEVKFKIDAVAERLRIEFQLELKDIQKTELENDLDVNILNDKVERLRNRLNNFGEINPMAVEAYDEMKIRYDDIQKQKSDIEEAKESLLETIKEIEETATGQFMEAFEKVRTSFIEVFRSLFSEEDNCDLILLNADNPLESSIEIVAKPKGKRPKSLSQLSGGEKTLTATALLFALYLLKPAPFCIFDEVDAPLDDANIQKFNKIIKKFSEHSQFIIVTHNKSTMAEVDILYGVYMQEQGVSGVTAVDFRDQKHNPILEALN